MFNVSYMSQSVYYLLTFTSRKMKKTYYAQLIFHNTLYQTNWFWWWCT